MGLILAGGFVLLGQNVFANDSKSSSKGADVNTLILHKDIDPFTISSITEILKDTFGENGFTIQTLRVGASDQIEIQYPALNGKVDQDLEERLQTLITGEKVTVGMIPKEGREPAGNATVCGTFHDWYWWTGRYISFCGPQGAYLQSWMYSMDNDANSFYESNTSWGAQSFDTPYYSGFLVDVWSDYWSLGSANNRISSVKIWF